jgi:hypothetical protein
VNDLLKLAPDDRKSPPDPECPSHQELIAEGWERRFLVGPERETEVTELYEALGYEVRLEKLEPEAFSESCGACPAVVCRDHLLLYTRRSAADNSLLESR